jgi:hypothetical protein
VRDWIALYPGILDSEKWGDLPDDTTRLAWIVALLLASRQPVEGRFDSAPHLSRLLRKEGIGGAEARVAELLSHGVLDADGDAVVIRGWTKWQKRWRGQSDDPFTDAERHREAYWRKKVEALEADILRLSPTVSEDLGPPRIEERRGEDREEKIGEEGRAGAGIIDADDRDLQDVFYELTGSRPWGKDVGRWLMEIEQGYGLTQAESAMRAEHRESVDKRTLVSRTEARVAKAADRAKEAKVKTRPKAKPVGVSEEQADRQRAALSEIINGAGKPPENGGTRDGSRVRGETRPRGEVLRPTEGA